MKKIVITACAVVLVAAAIWVMKMKSVATASSSELMMDAGAATRPKQLWTCAMHPQVIEDHPGFCPICHMKLVPLKTSSDEGVANSASSKRKILYYWDPMLGPSSISHSPGKSAMGMDLVPVYADEQSCGPAVTIDPAVVQNMGVRTAVVTRGPLSKTVRTVGMLEVPEPNQYDINLRISGWVTKLYADQLGMHVHQGEVLFELYSPDLQVAGEELVGAIKSLESGSSEYLRPGVSVQTEVAPESVDSNTSGAVRNESQELVASAKQKLRLWGVADEDIDAIVRSMKVPASFPFRSPANGDVIDKMVVEGSAVQAGMKVMRIEDHTKLWLEAEVYEQDIPLVALGQNVHATVEAAPGKIFSGPITFIYPHLDHMTRTETVRVTLDNSNREMKPGMYATANIVTTPVPHALWVPREAVIDTGTRQIVFVSLPQGHFEPRKVRMGLMGDDDRVQILQGLSVGETVVTSGEFLMDVESRTTEAIDKLRESSPSAAGGTMP